MPVSAIKSILHPVCKSLFSTYNGRYFSAEKNSQKSCMSVLSGVKFGATLRESDTYLEQFPTEKSKFKGGGILRGGRGGHGCPTF